MILWSEVMIKTLIIDDNKIIREYFQTMIDWEARGFSLCAVANNGIMGWQEFSRHRPDVVITDVQMPGMSGLELSRKIREVSPDTLIIFISSYDNFNYVKDALEIGAFDYILKHETKGEKFDKKLERIRLEFESRTQRRQHYYEGQLHLALASHSAGALSKLEEILPNRYSMLLLEPASILPAFGRYFPYQEEEPCEDVILKPTNASPYMICGVHTEDSGYLLLLKSGVDLTDFAKDLCQQIFYQQKLYMYGIPICERETISNSLSLFEKYHTCTRRKYFRKYDCIILPFESENTGNIIEHGEILETLNRLDIRKTSELIDHLAYMICSSCDYDLLCEISDLFLSFLVQKEKDLCDQSLVLYKEDDQKLWKNAEEIFFWFKTKFQEVFTCMHENHFDTYSKQVQEAIRYIRRNYLNDCLNVKEIADHTGMNIDHLNRLMKAETGMTVVKWLTTVRIDKAKQLILKNKKLTEIYPEVGYTNLSYFSNVFKKVCGITPLEYRRKTLEKETID